MTLNWENYGALADALDAKYPSEDLINIEDKRLVELVNTLDDFEDDAFPENKELIKAVHYAWLVLSE